jgi:Arc/MetJ-type ribon-helix-helix transcriptional regulator
LADKIVYSVLEIHARRIRELVESKKYKNPEDFLKNAIEILLTWESEHPEECMELMKSLMPFSSEQEKFMNISMDEEYRKKQLGDLEIDKDQDEATQQRVLAQTDDDHLKLRDNFQHTKKYIQELKIETLEDTIPFDGYPLLSGFYSRFLPVKIVITTLGHLLERSKDDKIELKDLRVYAYDIVEEIAETLSKYENENKIPRNKKMSTGLPKKGSKDKDDEKIAMAQKRFKDQFVGKVRKSRKLESNHFEGALSALGLVSAFEKDNKVYVSLTQLGKEFFLMDNPVVEGEYEKGPLTGEESKFIMKKLIPQRELEQEFVDVSLAVVKKFQKGTAQPKVFKKDFEKVTHTLSEEIKLTAIKYLKKNPKAQENYNLNHLESNSETSERKVTQWRLATMGRLSELKVVHWRINEKGDSEYSLN